MKNLSDDEKKLRLKLRLRISEIEKAVKLLPDKKVSSNVGEIKQLLQKLKEDPEESSEHINDIRHKFKSELKTGSLKDKGLTCRLYCKALLYGNPLTPLYESLYNYSTEFDAYKNTSTKTIAYKRSPISLRDDIPKRLLYTLLNPIKLLDDTLSFLHRAVNRILEIGLTKEAKTPFPQMFLKGLIGGVIMLVRAPLAVIKPVGNILPALVENIVVKPVRLIFNKIKSTVDSDLEESQESNSSNDPDSLHDRLSFSYSPFTLGDNDESRTSRSRASSFSDSRQSERAGSIIDEQEADENKDPKHTEKSP